MGKLIVLEGSDGVGKSTQFSLLTEHLHSAGQAFQTIVFPQYQEPSSALIRMYLGGEFGDSPSAVNPYAASLFYAVDRYASFQKKWGDYYRSGGLVVCDRYTSSNAVHQAGKVPPEDRADFYRWLCETEYERIGLPKPDLVIYLDAPVALSWAQLRAREAACHTTADIHEKDIEYLQACRRSGLDAAAYYGWQVVSCAQDGAMRSREAIHADVFRLVAKCLEE